MIRQSNTWQVTTTHAVATLVRRTRKRGVALAGLLVILGMSSVHAEKITYYVADAQGTVVATMNSQAAVTYTTAYRPYGKQAQGAAQTGPGYTGHVNDAATGLVYMQQRYYDPEAGRFLSVDPVVPAPGDVFNFGRYTYANNNPVRYTDPDGRCTDANGSCGVMARSLAADRLAHPNRPLTPIDKVAVAVAVVAGAVTGVDEAAGAASVLRSAARYVAGKVVKPEVKEGLPKNADGLLKQGYKETSHPSAAKAGHRSFENPKTGDKVRFDQGKPGKSGYEGKSHYHRYNPNSTSKQDQYIDKDGNPCARGCDASHLFPGD